jgi:hypothetical protein
MLEGRLIKHLTSLPYNDPFADWPHYVAAIEVQVSRRMRREANLFHSADMAQKWVQEVIASLPANQRPLARHTIELFPNRAAAERKARQFLGQ